MGPLVTPVELAGRLAARGVVLLDVRLGADARARYDAGHLAGALFVDVESELTGDASNPARGGRHPLPAPGDFAATLGRWGIGPEVPVVCVDDAGGAKAAARAWWMIRALGHAEVAVLDGGLAAAEQAGFALATEAGSPASRGAYPTQAWTLPCVELPAVEGRGARRLLDVRGPERFRGEVEPFDPRPGHIPGAESRPYAGSLDAQGRLLPPEQLRARFADATGAIFSCGSGITACHGLLALAAAGLPLHDAALYVGSYSEWSRSERPVETGD
ncbi:MAG: rhodanese-like domain-containing protein [Myxococcota bacterium]